MKLSLAAAFAARPRLLILDEATSCLLYTSTTATTMFLKQCLYCHGLPFEVRMDPFYSATNQAHLRRAIADLDAGNGKAHELIEVEDE